MKKLLLPILALALASAAPLFAEVASAPKTIVHIVTVSWKKDATAEQIKAALDGAQKLPAAYAGITHVWTKTLKAQGDRSNAIVMEFASAEAFKSYTDSPAQKDWYKVYLPVRDRSTTFDVTNE